MRNGLSRIWLVGFCLLMLTPGLALAEWISLDGGKATAPVVSVAEVNADRVVLEVQLSGFETAPAQIPEGQFAYVTLPGALPLLERGLPGLPFLVESIMIPDAGITELRVLKSQYREFASQPVLPSKGSINRNIDPATVPFAFDDLYQNGGTWPAMEAELGDPYILRDYRGVTVRIHPLRYDADRGILLALESMTLEIVTQGTGGANVKRRSADQGGIDAQFDHVYRQRFVNYDRAAKYAPLDRPGPMLVICDDALQGTIQSWVEWKRMTGLPVEVIAVSSVGASAAGVQGAITSRYNSPEGLTYVVLVGDIAQIPSNLGTEVSNTDSDPMYAMVDGSDQYPDLFISRISGSNPTEIGIQTAKFIRYERDPDLGAAGDWYAKSTGIASNEGSPSDAVRCDLLRTDLLAYHFTEVDQIYQGQGGSGAGISSALNQGRSLINYLGHGSGTGWGSVEFTNTDVYALSNGWAQPWIIDVACSNGDFSLGECFAEAWLRAGTILQPKGAIAMYGASNLSSWIPPTVMQSEIIDLLCAETENTLGSLYFSGGMEVLDQYAGYEGNKLIQQYNVFGDCSMMMRTTNPTEIVATHPAQIHLGSPGLSIETGVPGALATVFSDGVLYAKATADATGRVDMTFDIPVTTPGDYTLTILSYNTKPYQVVLPGVVPAQVVIAPTSIPVNVLSDVTVTVLDLEGAPMVGIDISPAGFGVSGIGGTTGASGQVVLNLTPLYGETIQINGRESGGAYDLFSEALPVTGAVPLNSAQIAASVPDIGMTGSLAPNLQGIVFGAAAETELTLYLSGCGVDLQSSDPGDSVGTFVIPDAAGTMNAVLAKAGYDLFLADIPVVEAFGTLAGVVTDLDNAGALVPGARVRIFEQGADPSGTPLYDLVTDAVGAFDVGEDIMVDTYDIYVDLFGYLAFEQAYFLQFGANDPTFGILQAPSGVLNGNVMATNDGAPLAALVRIYRSDNGALYDETSCDPKDGSYTSGSLPYSSYEIRVAAALHIPQVRALTLDAPTAVESFALKPTNGNLLIIDDGAPGDERLAKQAKDGSVIAAGYTARTTRSADDMQTELEAMGYAVVVEDLSSDSASWENYDVLVVASGSNSDPWGSNVFRAALESRALSGAAVLIEGGEVAYDWRNDSLGSTVLHVETWHADTAGDLTVAEPGHAVMSLPNVIAGPIDNGYIGYADADRVSPTADAVRVGGWSDYPTQGSVICYDSNPAPLGGQIVFFSFNYSVLGVGRTELLQNAIAYLTTPEAGDCDLSGRALLAGESDDSGITLRLQPAGLTATTDAEGSFSFTGVFEGDYTLMAEKEGWAAEPQAVSLVAGQILDGIHIALFPNTVVENCSTPALAIPDNSPTVGCSDVINVSGVAGLTGISVQLDISHTYIGDLRVQLTSPQGTSVYLHYSSGGTAEDIYAWYPDDLVPYQPLDGFLSEDPAGDWTLKVTDHANVDTGTLNAWCLRLESIDLSASGVGEAPRSIAHLGAAPNPFNPRTAISFNLEKSTRVKLSIYDLRGRMVRTLVDGELAAGPQRIDWFGRDDHGRGLGSGIYFYRLEAADRVFIRKLTLLK